MRKKYILQKFDNIEKDIDKLIKKFCENRSNTNESIREIKKRLSLLEGKPFEDRWKAVNPKVSNVKLTCDNSAFLQSLDEIEKKIDIIQEKINELKMTRRCSNED